MDFHLQRTSIESLTIQRNIFIGITFGLILLTILLSTGILFRNEKIIITPPDGDQEYWLTNKTISAEYLSQIANYFAQLRLNLTPENVAYQHKILLRHTSPKFYPHFKKILIAELARIQRTGISSVFYPIETHVDVNKKTVEIVGELKRSGLKLILPAIQKIYRIQFDYQNRKLLVTDFDEVKHVT